MDAGETPSFVRRAGGSEVELADPSQVGDGPAFFDLMAELAPHALPSFGSFLDGAAA